MNVFEINAKIGLDTTEYEKALKAAVNQGKQFASSLGQSNGNANEFTNSVKATTIALGNLAAAGIEKATSEMTNFAKESIQAGLSFDQSMSQVAATMGVSVDEVQNLRDFALEMGASTSYSASESAQALNYMALAGYDAEKSISMLPNVLNLAASGAMSLSRASDMVTDAQSALGLSMDETAELVNKMAMTASKSNTSVEQLGDAILQIGGTAKKIKGGTTELTAILGILADNGMKGAEGGTHLRNMLTSLMSPTQDATEMLDKLNVSLYDDEKNMRSLNDVFMDLRIAMSNMQNDAERNNVITTLFNARDMKAAEALLAGVGDRYQELTGYIDEAAGSAQAMANTQLDNLQGDITLFKSAIEGAQIAVSDRLTPSLRKLIKFGAEAVSEMSKGFGKNGVQGTVEALHKVIDKDFGNSAKIVYGVEAATKAALAAFITYKATVVGAAIVDKIVALNAAIAMTGSLTNALNAALNVNPLVIIATTAIAAGTAIKSVIDAQTDLIDVTVNGYDSLTDAQKEVVDSTKETLDIIQGNVEARETSLQSTLDEVQAYKKLEDRLYELNDVEDKSVEQKAEMAVIVDQLNDSIDGLNLKYNEQTGTLEESKKSVDELIDSYLREAKATEAKEQIISLTKDQTKAEELLTETEKARNDAIKKRDDQQKKLNALQERYNEEVKTYGWFYARYTKKQIEEETATLHELEDAVGETSNAYTEASRGLRIINEQMDQTRETLGATIYDTAEQTEETQNAIADTTETAAQSIETSIESVKRAAGIYYDDVNKIAGLTFDLNGKTVDLSQGSAEAIGELIDQYDSMIEQQRNAIENSINLFGGFEADTSTTFEDLWKNLNDTNYYLNDWATAIEQLGDKGISENLLQELKDMGTSSYNIVYGLNHATDEQLKNYSELWEKTSYDVDEITDRMLGNQKTTIEKEIAKIAEIPEAHIEEYKEEFAKLGVSADEGFAKGIKSKLEEVVKAAGEDIADIALEGTKEAQDSNSPSKEFEKLGEFAGEGFAIGIENKLDAVGIAAHNLAVHAINTVMETLDSHSPSKIFEKLGEYVPQGFALGIKNDTDLAGQSAKNMVKAAINEAEMLDTFGGLNYTAQINEADNSNRAQNSLEMPQNAIINLDVDGRTLATILAPFLDTIQGRTLRFSARGRQT